MDTKEIISKILNNNLTLIEFINVVSWKSSINQSTLCLLFDDIQYLPLNSSITLINQYRN